LIGDLHLEEVMLFSVAITQFLTFCAVEKRLSILTLDAYGRDLRDFQKFAADLSLLEAVPGERLRAYLEDLVGRRGLSTATAKRRLATLRGFFAWARDTLAAESPFDAWRPRMKRARRLPRSVPREDLRDLITPSPLTAPWGCELTHTIVVLFVATGLRVSELCKLSRKDISADGSRLHVHGKGSRERVVYVTDGGLQRRIVDLVEACALEPGAPLLINRNGRRLSPAAVRGRLHRLVRRTGCKRRITPHMLRHTAATLLIEEGVDIRLVQRLLGHASIATTEIYTHVADETLRSTLVRADVVGRLGRSALAA